MVNRLVLSAYVNSTGTLLSISAVAALWSASRGMYSFVMGLNAIYEPGHVQLCHGAQCHL